MSFYAYVIEKPGHELDGCEASFGANTIDDANEQAREHGAALGASMRFIGTHAGDHVRHRGFKLASGVDVSTLPGWAQDWVADEEVRRGKIRKRMARPDLARVEELAGREDAWREAKDRGAA